MNSLSHIKKCDFLKWWHLYVDLICARSTSHFEMTLYYLQSLDKALDVFIEFKFCESEFYFLKGSKNCMVATYNFGSVYFTSVCDLLKANQQTSKPDSTKLQSFINSKIPEDVSFTTPYIPTNLVYQLIHWRTLKTQIMKIIIVYIQNFFCLL